MNYFLNYCFLSFIFIPYLILCDGNVNTTKLADGFYCSQSKNVRNFSIGSKPSFHFAKFDIFSSAITYKKYMV